MIVIRNQLYVILLFGFVYFNLIDSYQQQTNSNNNETQISVKVSIDEKQKLEFHVNDFIYSEYDVCAIGKTTKDVYDCNSEQYDDAVEKVSLKVEG